MTSFKNTFKQNITIYIMFLITGNLLKMGLDASGVWYAVGVFSLGGIINSLSTFIGLFMLFALPFRPVRRFIWDNLIVRIHALTTIKTKPSIDSIETAVDTGNEIRFENIDQKLSNRMSTKKLSENHVIVKIK